jgi:hypothetical protein
MSSGVVTRTAYFAWRDASRFLSSLTEARRHGGTAARRHGGQGKAGTKRATAAKKETGKEEGVFTLSRGLRHHRPPPGDVQLTVSRSLTEARRHGGEGKAGTKRAPAAKKERGKERGSLEPTSFLRSFLTSSCKRDA